MAGPLFRLELEAMHVSVAAVLLGRLEGLVDDAARARADNETLNVSVIVGERGPRSFPFGAQADLGKEVNSSGLRPGEGVSNSPDRARSRRERSERLGALNLETPPKAETVLSSVRS